MFSSILIITLALVAYLTIRNWSKNPRTHQKTLKLASQEILVGNWQEAEKWLNSIGRPCREARLLQIQVLRGTKRLNKALSESCSAARAYPEELLFRLEEGLILLELDRPDEALSAFRVCAPIMRGESGVITLSTALIRAGYPKEAFDLLEPWVGSTQNGELIALMGDTYFETKRFQEAIAYYDRAVAMGHQTHHLYMQLGHAYRRLGNLSEAEKVFRQLLVKDRSDVAATLGLGACIEERGHHLKALLIYQSSGAWQTKATILMRQAGFCALKSGRYAYAESYFLEVVRRGEGEIADHMHYAFALENQEKWQEAEQVYLHMVKDFPSMAHGYRGLAWMFGAGLTRTVSADQGMSYARIALKLKNDLVSWEILSAVEARVGRFERAYQIQMGLAQQDKERGTRIRRQRALRALRHQSPLNGEHLTRSLVA